ncbi:ABC transporter substrate-binding protein [Phycicoccus sp. Soil803]|uniref:ABC transporter substrate-binding protein n=1 Tax=Phycicoccus sp. Soil803 TaxID=1736415 RepID=UPI001F458201|nr:ABC transporter substrate-binding protein [Phycicoccus sp. Soil803]
MLPLTNTSTSLKGTIMRVGTKLAAVASGAALLVTISACGGGGGADASAAAGADGTSADSLPQVQPAAAAVKLLPAALKERGTLTMAADLHYPPTSFLDTDNKTPIGYNVDIATLLAKSLGMKLEIKNVSFDGVVPGIAAGRYDFTATNMSPTPERLKVLDMVTYWAAGSSLVTSKGNPLKLSISEQMTLCGHKIAVVTGSTQAEKYLPQISGDCSAQGKPPVDTVVLPNVQAALTQLASKRIEGVFNDTSQLAWAAKQQPQAFELSPQQYKKKVGNSIVALGVAKNSPLAPALHAAMQSLMAGPAYKATLDKWGLGTGAISTSELLK